MQDVVLHAEMVKNLQACSASHPSSTTSSRPSGPSATTTKPNAPSGTSAADYIVQGDNYRQAKKYPEAIEAYKKSISIAPSTGAYSRLGVVYLDDLKQYRDALTAFQAAVRLEPNNSSSHRNLASVFYSLEEYEQAVVEAQQAIRLEPGYAKVWNLLGISLAPLDRYTEAVAAHKEALRLQPNNALYVQNLAVTHLDAGRKEDALEVCKLLQKINPTKAKELYDEINASFPKDDEANGNLLFGLDFYEVGARGYRNALRSLRRVILFKPEATVLGRAHYVIGSIYLDRKKFGPATGEFELAIAAYQQAIRLEPREASNYFWLGMIDVELGRKADALRVYKTLQSIDPAKAKELYGEINKKQ